MKKDDTLYLRHILEAIALVEGYLQDKTYDDFEGNRMLQDAVIREIEIIGEALNIFQKDSERGIPRFHGDQ